MHMCVYEGEEEFNKKTLISIWNATKNSEKSK